jgi:hypothetical protein
MTYKEWWGIKDQVSVKSPEEKRILKLAELDIESNYFDQLLNNRSATARQVFVCNDPMIKEKFVKYLEMIENEIKKALILE